MYCLLWVLIFEGFGGWLWKRVLREERKRKESWDFAAEEMGCMNRSFCVGVCIGLVLISTARFCVGVTDPVDGKV